METRKNPGAQWQNTGVRPRGCDTIDRAARATNPEFTTVWRGSALPTEYQGIKVLGCPLGHDDFVHAHLERTHQTHQSAWALLLHCASAKANYSLRVVRSELVAQFAAAHDAGLWSCLCHIVNVAPDQCSASARDAATLPLCLGELGLRSASRTSCVLGKLGGFIAHDPPTAPWGCGPICGRSGRWGSDSRFGICSGRGETSSSG